jgi:hypothetical protein
MYAMYYASMLRYWQLIRIMVRTNHPCLRVGHHSHPPSVELHCCGGPHYIELPLLQTPKSEHPSCRSPSHYFPPPIVSPFHR